LCNRKISGTVVYIHVPTRINKSVNQVNINSSSSSDHASSEPIASALASASQHTTFSIYNGKDGGVVRKLFFLSAPTITN